MNDGTVVKSSSVFFPFLAGGIVGAAIGLLIAPRRGSDVRRQIKDFATDTRDKVTATIDKGMDVYDDARIAVSSAIHAGKQAYMQERERFQAH